MYQNLIYISRYLDFYYQILNPYILLPTPHPYLPLTTSTPIYPYPPPPLPASEQFLQGQLSHVPWTLLFLVAKYQMSSGPHRPIFSVSIAVYMWVLKGVSHREDELVSK